MLPSVVAPAPGAGERSDESLPRRRRIAERRDFQKTYDEGAKRHGRYVVVFVRPGGEEARLGVTVTRKVGDAAVRNLLKRRVREIYRRRASAPGLDVVVNLKRDAVEAPFTALREDLEKALSALEARIRG